MAVPKPGQLTVAARLAVVQAVTDVGLLPLTPAGTSREVLERVRTGFGASAATILLVEDGGRALVAWASAGLEVEVAAALRIPMGAGLTGRVAASGKPVLVPESRWPVR